MELELDEGLLSCAIMRCPKKLPSVHFQLADADVAGPVSDGAGLGLQEA